MSNSNLNIPGIVKGELESELFRLRFYREYVQTYRVKGFRQCLLNHSLNGQQAMKEWIDMPLWQLNSRRPLISLPDGDTPCQASFIYNRLTHSLLWLPEEVDIEFAARNDKRSLRQICQEELPAVAIAAIIVMTLLSYTQM